MNSAIFKTILATFLALGLSAAVLGQSDEAFAKSDSSSKSMKQDKSASQSSGEMDSTKQKADFLKSWASAEKPGQHFAGYASSGLSLIDSALNSIVDDVRQQPIGGGPSDQDQNKQKSEQALSNIDQNHQELSKLASDLEQTSDVSQHPQQFQEAATTVSEMFSSLQEARFPKLKSDVKKVSDAVDKLKVDQPLAAQSKSIERFFSSSSDVINKMSKELEKSAVGGGPEESQQEPKEQPDQQKENVGGGPDESQQEPADQPDPQEPQMDQQEPQPANPDMPSDTQ